MKYNKNEIMKAAWAAYRGLSRNLRGEIQGTFADCLKMAWATAKRKAEQTAESAYFLLQMKDHWTNEDYETARRYEQSAA